jgi:hypothetical protein
MQELVWAFAPVKELNGVTGFVECDSSLAAKLIEEGRVQDPRVGALHLKEITDHSEDMAPVKKRAPKNVEGEK